MGHPFLLPKIFHVGSQLGEGGNDSPDSIARPIEGYHGETRMFRIVFVFCLTLPLWGCAELLKLDEFSSGKPDAGQGGTAGSGGEAGAGGSAGAGGQGGGGGNPCTGIYLTLDSVTSQTSYTHTSGNVTYATYLLYGTSTGNELSSFMLTNNTGGDFTSPVATTALESMRVRCSDPNGGPSWPIACDLDISTGTANCLNPDPQANYPANVCGDQTLLPMVTITN